MTLRSQDGMMDAKRESLARLLQQKKAHRDIAVIGLSGRYPRSPTLEAFWDNLRRGRSCIDEIPRDRWRWEDHYDPDPGVGGKHYTRWGGFIEDVDKFDPLFFRVTAKDAENMDPQERLFLETSWACLEDGGYTTESLARHAFKVGVFVGVMNCNYEWLSAASCARGRMTGAQSAYWSIANRVSFFLNLQGPSLAVDTACSASMTAIHLACESLRRGECEAAVAGGVNLILHPMHYLRLTHMRMLSPDDKCKSFGAGANGFVDGEGVGAVLLKPLVRALADGDRIYGVIKGSAINAGGRTNGYTVPNPNAQADLILAALASTGIDPRTISYIEAHGTGTSLGDPIEIAGLTSAYRRYTGDKGYCAIGSVKSNIGHLEAAAGIAGLTKVLLQLHNKQLVPSLHSERLNEKISFADSPFHVQRELSPWPEGTSLGAGDPPPRRAGVSSFGAGGANAHVLVEEFVDPRPRDERREGAPVVIALSARSRDRLEAHAGNLKAFLERRGDEAPALSDIAHTLQVGREPMEERLAFVAASRRELVDKLDRFARGSADGFWQGRAGKAPARALPDGAGSGGAGAGRLEEIARHWAEGGDVAWRQLAVSPAGRLVSLPSYPFARESYWLPGGPGMAGELLKPAPAPAPAHPVAEVAPVARATWLHPLLQQNVSTLDEQRFYAPLDGLPEALSDLAIHHRRIVPGAALLEMALEAGRISLRRPVRDLTGVIWGRPLQAEAGRGLHVGLHPREDGVAFQVSSTGDGGDEVIHLQGVLERGGASAVAEPERFDLGAIEARCGAPRDRASFYRGLAESGVAAGSPWQVIEGYRAHRGEALSRLAIPASMSGWGLASSWLLGALHTATALAAEGRAAGPALLAGELGSLRWFADLPSAGLVYVVPIERDAGGDEGQRAGAVRGFRIWLLDAEGRVLTHLDRVSLDDAEARHLASQRDEGSHRGPVLDTGAGRRATFLYKRWREQARPSSSLPQVAGSVAVLADAATLPVAERLFRGDGSLQKIVLRTDAPGPGSGVWFRPDSAGQGAEAAERLLGAHPDLAGLIDLSDIDPALGLDGGASAGKMAFLQRLLVARRTAFRVLHFTSGLLPFRADRGSLAGASFAGLVRALGAEYRGLVARTVDVDRAAAGADVLPSLVESEWSLPPEEGEACYRGGVRHQPYLSERGADGGAGAAPSPAGAWSPDKVWVVTGGTRGIGAEVARHLVERGVKRLVVMGLRPLSDGARATEPSAGSDARERRIQALEQRGASVRTYTGPLTDRPRLERFFEQVRAEWGPIGGVIHCAGLADHERPAFIDKSAASIARVLEPKVAGLGVLHQIFERDGLERFVLFSSVSALVPALAVGAADYAAANAFMDCFAARQHALGWHGYRSLAWPAWGETGMGDPRSPRLGRLGLAPLTTAEGLALLDAALAREAEPTGMPCVLVEGTIPMERWLRVDAAAEQPVPAAAEQPAAAGGAQRPERVDAALLAFLGGIVSQAIGIAEERLDPETSFADFGIDSILLVDLVKKAERHIGASLDPSVFLEYPTLARLSAYLGERYPGAAQPASAAVSAPAPAVVSAPAPAVVSAPAPAVVSASPTGSAPYARDLVPFAKGAHRSSTSGTAAPRPAIAVIGVACHFPQSPDKETFWRNLESGADLITEVSPSRWDPERYYDAARSPGRTISKWGGFIDGIELFDPEYFRMSPESAPFVDPLIRKALEVGVACLRDAGYEERELAGQRVGVFMGARTANFTDKITMPAKNGIPGVAQNFVAALLAHFLDLKGPNLVVDTACSSSLVGIHLACQSLLCGESTMALAGGVDILLDEKPFVSLSEAGALSPDGRCHVFDERANGFVPGEGCGAVLLKTLDRALADGDRIYAVIEGSAVNNDGRTMGVTTPNPDAQGQVIEQALARAGASADTVSYVEAHGTGTMIGDPIELRALTRVFRKSSQDRGFCAVGSVKSNMGHLLSAAGVASFIKVVLSLWHRRLPPTLHCSAPNPRFEFASSPFYPNTALQDWLPRNGVRRAGISSFGFGGTNAHVIVGELPAATATRERRRPLPAPAFDRRRFWPDGRADDRAERELPLLALRRVDLGGDDRIRLETSMSNDDYIVRDHRVHGVRIMPGVTFLDLIYRAAESAGLPRDGLELRHILFKNALATGAAFDRQIRVDLERRGGAWRATAASRKARDGRALSDEWEENFECEIHRAEADAPPPLDLDRLRRQAAQSLDVDDAYAVARAMEIQHFEFMKGRGKIHRGDGFVLAELHLGELASRHRHDFHVHPAFLDCSTLVPAKLDPSAPSATKPCIPIYLEAFRAFRGSGERCHVLFRGQDARRPASEDIFHIDIDLFDEVGNPLAWFRNLSIKRIRSQASLTRLDLAEGAAAAATGTVAPRVAPPPAPSAAPAAGATVDTPAPRESAAAPAARPALSRALVERELIDMVASASGRPADEISLEAGFYDQGLDSTNLLQMVRDLERRLGTRLYPTLLFEYKSVVELTDHLLEHHAGAWASALSSGPAEKPAPGPEPTAHAPAQLLAFAPTWEDASLPPGARAGAPARVLLLSDDEALARALASRGQAVTQVSLGAAFRALGADRYEIRAASAEDCQQLLDALAARGGVPGHVLHGCRPAASLEDGLARGLHTVLPLTQALLARGPAGRITLLHAHLDRDGRPAAWDAAFGGFARSVRLESPRAVYKSIGLPDDLASAADLLLAELTEAPEDVEVRYSAGKRQVRRLREIELPGDAGQPLRQGGVHLITGGMGGIGWRFAEHLVDRARARLVLCGRSPLDADRQRRLNALRARGAEVLYLDADVSRREDVARVIERARARFGELHGVIHAAGVIRDALIPRKTREQVDAVLGPKVHGAAHLDALTRSEPLDLFVTFSSSAGITGNAGQCDYAFANRFLDQLVEGRAASGAPGRSLSIAWPLWAEGGMRVDAATEQALWQATGMKALSTAAGIAAFERGLRARTAVMMVAEGSAERLRSFLAPGQPPPPRRGAPEAWTDPGHVEPGRPPQGPSARLPAAVAAPADDIAVIGVSGRYPMADDLDAFWENLAAGRDCITEVPADRFPVDAYYDPEVGKLGKTYTRWGGFLRDVDRFDPLVFNIAPREAELMDPQERLFLETAWATLENAGYARGALARRRVGVFAGVMWGQYQLLGAERAGRSAVLPASIFASIANRVSYCFDLRGPSLAVDTMCSSSLTAIHLACESIRRGECEMALAGGVNVTVHPMKYLYLSQGRMVSTDGRCRGFGQGGDGYVPGEGVGAVLLKPLSRALEDGDHIHAVIKGTAINHGGRSSGYTVPNPEAHGALIRDALRASGFEPGSVSYIEAHGTGTALGDPIEMAGLVAAFPGVPARSRALGTVKSNIGHLEAAAGIAALTKVLLQLEHRQLAPSLHADPPNPNIDFDASPFHVQRELAAWQPPEVPGQEGRARYPRRAGISSFGAGGNNVHVLLEEHAPEADGPGEPDLRAQLVILSARKPAQLEALAGRLLDFVRRPAADSAAGSGAARGGAAAERAIEDALIEILIERLGVRAADVDPELELEELGVDPPALVRVGQQIRERFHRDLGPDVLSRSSVRGLARSLAERSDGAAARGSAGSGGARARLADLAYTLQVGREPMAERLALVVSTVAELEEKLAAFCRDPGAASGVFRGRAAGRHGTARRGAEQESLPALAEGGRLDRIAALWVAGADIDWKALFPERRARRVPLPTYPFARERYWLADLDPAGPAREPAREHPLLARLDGAASLGQGLTFRGGLGADAPLLTDHRVGSRAILPGVAHLEMAFAAARHIWGEQRVALAKVYWVRPAALEGARLDLRLAVREEGGAATFEVHGGDPAAPVLHARGKLVLDGASSGAVEGEAVESIQARCRDRVEGEALYARYRQMGMDYGPHCRAVEQVWVGDGEALAALALPASAAAELDRYHLHPVLLDSALHAALALVSGEGQPGSPVMPFSVERVELLRPPRARMFAHLSGDGAQTFRMTLLDESGRVSARVHGLASRPLPRPTQPPPRPTRPPPRPTQPPPRPSRPFYFLPAWQSAPSPPPPQGRRADLERGASAGRATIIVHHPSAAALKDALVQAHGGARVIEIELGMAARPRGDGRWTVNVEDTASFDPCLRSVSLLDTVYFLGEASGGAAADLAASRRSAAYGVSALFRFYKALRLHPAFREPFSLKTVGVQAIPLHRDDAVSPHGAALYGLTKVIAKEHPSVRVCCLDIDGAPLREGASPDELRDTAQAILAEPCSARAQEVLIRAGARYTRRLVPLDLPASEPPFRERGVYLIIGGAGQIGLAFARHLAARVSARVALVGRRELDDDRRREIAAIEALGGEALYLKADVSDLESMRRAVGEVRARFGAIHGVVHSALVLHQRSLAELDEATFARELAPKMDGSVIVEALFAGEPLDFMVFFSSASAFQVNARQAGYAAGSMFTDAAAHHLARQRPYPVKTINWGYWRSVGAVSPELVQRLETAGVEPIRDEEGMAAIEVILASRQIQVAAIKASAAVLANVGVDSTRSFLEQAEPAPSVLEAIARRGLQPSLDAGAIDRFRAAFEALGASARRALAETFRSMGVFLALGERWTEPALRARLGVVAAHERLFHALLRMLCEGGYLERAGDDHVVRALAEPVAPVSGGGAALAARHPEVAPFIELVWDCLAEYPAVLTGRKQATEVLFPRGSMDRVKRIYQGNAVTDFHNRLVAEVVVAYVEERLAREPGAAIHVVEVGAGTGGTSAFVLDALARLGARVHYAYTDCSSYFVRHGEKVFAPAYPFARFAVLDIEADPGPQGFEPGSVDIVLATNVLHATRRIEHTLGRARALLRANGLLVLNEATRPQDFATLTFGLTEGWWLFEDAPLRLPSSPLLSIGRWSDLLGVSGFRGVQRHGLPGVAVEDMAQCVFVAESDGLVAVAADQAAAASGARAAAANGAAARAPAARRDVPRGGADAALRPVTVPAASASAAGEEALRRRAEGHVRGVFARVLGMSAADIDVEAELETYGIDSLLIAQINEALEKDLGDLPATLLFECRTLAEVVDHLLEAHRPSLQRRFGAPAAAVPSAAPAPPSTPAEAVAPPPVRLAAVAPAPERGAPELRELCEEYVRRVIARVLKIAGSELDRDAGFDTYGVDSLLAMELADAFAKDLGDMPSTLVFERQTVAEVATYLLEGHEEALRRTLGLAPRASAAAVAEVDGDVSAEVEAGRSEEIAPVSSQRRRESAPERVRPGAASGGDIAIIGIGGRYPKSADVRELWENLKAGRSCIGEVPPHRWDGDAYYRPDGGGASRSKWGGFLEDVDRFDPLLFNISPLEAERLDPQLRLFLETAWETFEDAGYPRRRLRLVQQGATSGVGVFVGSMYQHYPFVAPDGATAAQLSCFPGSAIANRVSHYFDLKGPSMLVDTACSSSLTAIYMACESLARGDCAMALAGGVNLSLHPQKYVTFSQMGLLGSKERSCSLGEGDGITLGEGVGALLLKPLALALRDGDRVYAVIKGGFVNHGGRTHGATVPNPNAQADLIVEAFRRAGVRPDAVSYIEVAANGSSLGDSIEIAGLKQAFRRFEVERGSCALGSVKSSIGHLEAASGVSQVTKVAYQLHHRTLVPTLNSEPLNPKIRLDDSPFHVQRERAPWRPAAEGEPLCAAVASFGAGGANAYLILESFAGAEGAPRPDPRQPCVLVLSGRDEDRLKAYAERIGSFLEASPETPLDAVAYTLQIGREPLGARLALIATDAASAAARLLAFARGGEEGIDDLVRGDVGTTPAASRLLLDGREGEAYLRIVIEERKLRKLAQLWVSGVDVDWRLLYPEGAPPLAYLPAYPFERRVCWIGQGEAPFWSQPPQQTSMGNGAAEEHAEAPRRLHGTNGEHADRLVEDLGALVAQSLKLPSGALSPDRELSLYGVDSITGAMLAGRVKSVFGVDVPAPASGGASTLRRWAEQLRQRGGKLSLPEVTPLMPELIPMNPAGTRPASFWCHGALGFGQIFRPLSAALGQDYPVYALQARGVDGTRLPFYRLEDMLAHYVACIRSVRPRGPYCIGGYSSGGILALELARELHRQGETVSRVILLDTYPPTPEVQRWFAGFMDDDYLYVAVAAMLFAPGRADGLVSPEELRGTSPEVRLGHLASLLAERLGAGWSRDEIYTLLQGAVNVARYTGQALHGYEPSRYDASDVLYFRAGAGFVDPGRAGSGLTRGVGPDAPDHVAPWRDIVASRLDVVTVPADHFSLLSGPGLAAIKEHLVRLFDRLRLLDGAARPGPSSPEQVVPRSEHDLPAIIEQEGG
ncbi:SDR family NAD(P)-dependent oxidoreductase [Sorangium sp. So ce1151]|uniref:SDR family NAD(P)-dependent oxidoreductase n=1 Tax=Sorangium sp. So ce1151 TaxID=3133332 RepID=UPI003F620CD3